MIKVGIERNISMGRNGWSKLTHYSNKPGAEGRTVEWSAANLAFEMYIQ